MGTAIATQVIPQGLLVPRSALGEWLERGVEAIKERERIVIRPRSPRPEERSGQKLALNLSSRETELLREISRGLSQEDWQHYRELVAKRRAETLTPTEQSALIALSDEIEAANVHRIERLIELSRLRNTPLEALMDQLGIKAPVYA